MLSRGNATARQQIEDQTATVDRYAEITDRKAALLSENQQLDRFLAGCIPFRDALASLAEGMPESAALTRLDLTYPAVMPSRGAKPGAKAPPPGATIHLYGVTTNPDDVEAIRSAFSTGPATNVIVEASVPSGSFRTDPAAGPGHFRFEIVAKGMPRAFEPPKNAPKKGGSRP